MPKEQRRESAQLRYALTATALVCIIFLITFAGCSAHKTSSIPAFSYLHAPPASHKLIVFVHGFTGDPIATWTNESGVSWADLINGDDQLRDFTVWVHHYDTPLLQQTSTIEETATRFLRQLKDERAFDNFKEIYFIAHSMGGLVVKRALADLNRETEIDRLRKIKAVLFISTPSQGTSLAQLASLLSLNPQVRDMTAANLNSYLQSIENQWQNLMRDRGNRSFPKSYCAYETKPTHGGIVIVDRVSAATFCDDNMFPVPTDHRNIAKPWDAQSDIYRWAQARLLEASKLVQSTAQTTISVQVAPRVLHYVEHYKIDGEITRHNEYGFGLVIRVRNKGEKLERIKALEIVGDIDANINDFGRIAEGKTTEAIDGEYKETQPYYRVSFVSFPINGNKIEPGSEEFVRFMLLDPTNLSTMATVRADGAWKYIGLRAGKPRQPLVLTTVPNIFSFVTFTQTQHIVPGNAEFLAPRLRREIKSGAMKFILRFESGSREIEATDIQGPNLVFWEDWNKLIPQDIFYKNTSWDRTIPVTKDPLVESGP